MNVGEIKKGVVTSIFKTHFLVELENGYSGLVHITESSDYFVSNIKNMFVVGKKYDFLVLDVDDKNKRTKLSWKKITPRFQIDPFSFEINETESGFKNLKEHVEKEVEND